MPYYVPEEDPIASDLRIEHIVFDSITFERSGFPTKDKDNLKLQMKVSIAKDTLDITRVTVEVSAEKPEEYVATVAISGFCRVSETSEISDVLIKKNAVAILFPYVRAELSLLTAQPEMDPVVLPPINVGKLIDQMDTPTE